MDDHDQLLHELELRLGYRFADRELLVTALTHKSYANEGPERFEHNERMEFLGDAVVSLVVGHLLMHRFPAVDEGMLSKARALLVSAPALAELARKLRLGEALRLGRGERHSGGRRKSSILADTFEAVSAAVYLDGGFEAAFPVLEDLFAPELGEALEGVRLQDPKTLLQERIQAITKRPPTYRLESTRGPEHALRFTVSLLVNDRVLARAEGRTKKEAAQEAARLVMKRLAEGEVLDELIGPLP